MPSKRKVRADDLFRMSIPGEPAVSPCGAWVAYTLKRMDPKENRYLAHLWLAPSRGGGARQLTQGDRVDAGPAWSPDGRRIAFASTRDKKTRLYLIPADGGEARPLGRLAGTFSGLAFSPDGKSLLVLHRPRKDEPPEEKAKKPAFKHIKHLSHKLDGFGYFPPEKQHAWIVSVPGGQARQLTKGEYDVHEAHWSPDGRQVAYLANPDPEMQHEGTRIQLHVVRAAGGRPRAVTTKPGSKMYFGWAPEGESLVFAGHFGGPGEWIKHPYHLWEVSLTGERYTDLTPRRDQWPFNFTVADTAPGDLSGIHRYREGGAWRFAFASAERGAGHVVSIARGGGAERLEFGGAVNAYGLHVTADGEAAVAAATMMDMGDVYRLRLDGKGASRRLTRANRALLGALDLTAPEEHWVTSGKAKVHTWILKPPGFRAGRRYPALLEIHGGPMAQYGHIFFHEMHLLAAQGYVVAFSNPRGSCGYGTDWVKSIHGRWGTVDYDDLMAVTNFVVRQPYVDGRRLGVLGGSYGGFMTTWVLAHSRRFKAGVTMRQAGNRWMQFASADYNQHEYHSFKAWPWEKPMAYLKQSPNFHAHRIKAPTLIIHSENDLRCPIAQADELFTILKVNGVETEYIRFEGESHGLSRGGRPRNRVERLERILDWFKRHL
jgi:dipeptidyl aminopeptidase/acylaminoacyl peptidase